jgi:hypothetical protein
LHAVLDASASWRRLGRAAATVGIIGTLRRSERTSSRRGVGLTNGQDELGFDVDPLEKAIRQLAGPVHCASLTETERIQTFADLREWVEQLVGRLATEVRVIHPAGIDTTG